jgi:predicted nucleotidyltransferase
MNGLPILQDFKRRAETALPGRVRKVLLYGSHARGDFHSDSDWDVAVFLASEPDHIDRRELSGAAFDVMTESEETFIHPVALAISNYDDDTLLMHNIRRDGIEI